MSLKLAFSTLQKTDLCFLKSEFSAKPQDKFSNKLCDWDTSSRKRLLVFLMEEKSPFRRKTKLLEKERLLSSFTDRICYYNSFELLHLHILHCLQLPHINVFKEMLLTDCPNALFLAKFTSQQYYSTRTRPTVIN